MHSFCCHNRHLSILWIRKLRFSVKAKFVSHTAYSKKKKKTVFFLFKINKSKPQKIPTCSEVDKGRGKDPSSFSNSFVSLASWFVECCNCCLREKRYVLGYSHFLRAVSISLFSELSHDAGNERAPEGMGSQMLRFTTKFPKYHPVKLTSSCLHVNE